jgi:hypothetical protein
MSQLKTKHRQIPLDTQHLSARADFPRALLLIAKAVIAIDALTANCHEISPQSC